MKETYLKTLKKDIDFGKIYDGLISHDEMTRKHAIADLYDAYNLKFTRELQYKFPNFDSHLIEDLVQDSFFKIMDRRATPKAAKSIVGWLRKIVFNTAIDKCRQLKNRNLEDSIEQSEEESGISIIDQEEISSKESPFTRDCIHRAYEKYAEKNSEEFEIFSTFSLAPDSSQKSLSDLYGKSLSAIKKICAQTQKALESLIDPCLE